MNLMNFYDLIIPQMKLKLAANGAAGFDRRPGFAIC